MREGDSPEGGQVSSLPGELSISPQDDDAVTVRSTDTCAPRAEAKDDSSLTENVLEGTSRSAGSSSSSKPSLKPSGQRVSNPGSRVSSAEEETTAGGVRVRLKGRSSGNLSDSCTNDHLAVFEDLKLEEQQSSSSVSDRPILETDGREAWFHNQRAIQNPVLGIPGMVPTDIPSLNDPPVSDGNSDMGISLQEDKRGKLDDNLTSFGPPESADELEYEGTQPSKPHIPKIVTFFNSHLQTTPQTIFTSFWCPKLQTAQNVGLFSTSSSTFARLAARRRPCHVLRLPQLLWERARVVPPPSPITIIVGIAPTRSMKYKSHPNRHWFLQARQGLHRRQRALDMNFVTPASKRSAAITHCLSV